MNNLQYIRDNSGKPLYVILPIAEFEKLVGLMSTALELKKMIVKNGKMYPMKKMIMMQLLSLLMLSKSSMRII